MLGHKLDELKLQLKCQTTGPHLVTSLKSKGTSAKKNVCPFLEKIQGVSKILCRSNDFSCNKFIEVIAKLSIKRVMNDKTSSSSLKCQALQLNYNDWFCRSSVLYLVHR